MKKITIIVLFLFSCSGGEGELDKLMNKRIKKADPMGMVITLTDSSGELWHSSYGYMDYENRIEVDSNTIFPIASLTKVITATAVMQLWEEELIALDDDIGKYINELQGWNISIKDLLTHYSGLPADLGSVKGSSYKDVPALLNQEKVIYKPGELFLYSNVNYVLLGIIVERVRGRSFILSVEETIFRPLNMKESSFSSTGENVTKLYSGRDEVQYPTDWDLPAGGLYTSSEDLSNFMKDLLSDSPTVLEKSTVDLMFSKQNGGRAMGSVFDIGMSYYLGEFSNYKTVYHYGDEDSVHSLIYFVPELKIGVTILLNSEEGKSSRVPLAKELISRYLREKSGIVLDKEVKIKGKKIPGTYLNTFNGVFAGFPGHVLLKSSGERLSMKLFGIKLNLSFNGEDVFYPEFRILGIPVKIDFLEGVYFKIVREGDSYTLAPYIDDAFLGFLERVKPIEYPDIWDDRSGRYSSRDSRIYEVGYNQDINFYTVKYEWAGMEIESVLKPISPNRAITVGHAQNCGQVFTFGNKSSFRGDHNLTLTMD